MKPTKIKKDDRITIRTNSCISATISTIVIENSVGDIIGVLRISNDGSQSELKTGRLFIDVLKIKGVKIKTTK